jgi:hypothetical protein
MGELLAYVATHEVGHALGLRHNFKAPAAYTVEQTAQPEMDRAVGHVGVDHVVRAVQLCRAAGRQRLSVPKFGPYDYFAIDWGYRQYGNGMTFDDEWPLLDRLAAQAAGRSDAALRRSRIPWPRSIPASARRCWALTPSPPPTWDCATSIA